MRFHRMPQGKLSVNAVDIAPTLTRPLQDAASFELGYDLVNRPLRDSNRCREVTQPHLRIGSQTEQDMRMIGKKGPVTLIRTRNCRFFHFYD